MTSDEAYEVHNKAELVKISFVAIKAAFQAGWEAKEAEQKQDKTTWRYYPK